MHNIDFMKVVYDACVGCVIVDEPYLIADFLHGFLWKIFVLD